MKITKLAVTPLTGALALVSLAGPLAAETLSEQNKQLLSAYEKVHDALVADDLTGAQKAAADLGPTGAGLTKSKSLEEARAAFEKLSAQAKQLTAGQPGYYLVHCPMLKKDWVQTSTAVANPYGGKGMTSCGEVSK